MYLASNKRGKLAIEVQAAQRPDDDKRLLHANLTFGALQSLGSKVEASIAACSSIQTTLSSPKDDGSPSQQAGTALFKNVILKRWQGTAFQNPCC